MESKSEIVQFYNNKSIFITGGTGFVGKTVIEKLLRTCPKIKNIFILTRPKYGVEINERISEIINNPLFGTVRSGNPEIFAKLIPISGDIGLENLGISKEDQETLLEEVSIVIHAAATIKFEEPIKIAINLNCVGTIRILEFCKQMKKLEAFVHISTAFVHCEKNETQEIVYPPHTNPYILLEYLDSISDYCSEKITPELLKETKKPNTYIYSKSLAENIVNFECKNIPVIIVRPSILASTWKDPVEGWMDKSSPFLNISIGVGKGAIRALFSNKENILDGFPIDTFANCILASAWYKSICKERSNETHVYNCCSGNINPITCYQSILWTSKYFRKYPLQDVYWYLPGTEIFQPNKILYKIRCLFFHNIPAYLIDFAFIISGKKPRVVSIYKKIHSGLDILAYFTNGSLKCDTNEMMELQSKMCLEDHKIFNLDISKLDWEDYVNNFSRGVSKYIFKEDPKNMSKARAHLKKLYWIRNIINLIIIFTFAFFLYLILQKLF